MPERSPSSRWSARTSPTATRRVHADLGIPFVEVFVDTPLDECERRDPKGLYARARAGEIPSFTGVSDPYERPVAPDVVVTAGESLETWVETVLRILDDLRA